ncbi:MAG: 50S ribosomal protein L32 [Actinobacteria bacterium]|nr:50S ribosomal protein L32 [Actinomycetota bacterium]
MPVPKRKTSRSNTRHRRSAWKTTPPTLAMCECGRTKKLSHQVCPECGRYRGRQVLPPKA